MEEVTDHKQKCDLTKKHPGNKFVPTCDFRIKTEHLDSSMEEEDIVEIFPGEPYGHFVQPKTNKNPPEVHSFKCEICKAVFRDQNELRNHNSNHKMEFYHCLVCHKYLRLPQSFENHQASHNGSKQCSECGTYFALKMSLYNHMQVHSTERMKCSHDDCLCAFKHCQNQLEHIQYSHRKTKDVPCSICKKMFQMPTSMRAHRKHWHGAAHNLIPGHPLWNIQVH